MGLEENKQLVRRFREEVWNQGNVDAVDVLRGPDYVHNFLASGIITQQEGLKRVVEHTQRPVPVLCFMIEALLAEGDQVMERWTARRCDGAAGVARGIDLYRIVEGKIVEQWGDWRHLELLASDQCIVADGKDQAS